MKKTSVARGTLGVVSALVLTVGTMPAVPVTAFGDEPVVVNQSETKSEQTPAPEDEKQVVGTADQGEQPADAATIPAPEQSNSEVEKIPAPEAEKIPAPEAEKTVVPEAEKKP